mmetsp:Transcript_3698/g.4254  ORF Transcript_3698/g.4254 Transcript_3698/m.4254 type:complete len:419 (+) Transcript_3698:348-1604(+)
MKTASLQQRQYFWLLAFLIGLVYLTVKNTFVSLTKRNMSSNDGRFTEAKIIEYSEVDSEQEPDDSLRKCAVAENCSLEEANNSVKLLNQQLSKSKIPVIIGGIGDSGTRGVWQVCKDFQVFMGSPKELWKTSKDCSPFMYSYNVTRDNGTIVRKGASHFYNPGLRSSGSLDYNYSVFRDSERWHMGIQYMTQVLSKLYSSVQAFQNAPERLKRYEHTWGFKHPRTVAMLPFLKEVLKNKTFKYIHVIRDVRDVSKGDNQAFYRSLCSQLYKGNDHEQNCVEAPGGKRIMARMKFWSKLNFEVVKWAKTHLNEKSYLLVRIEDLVLGKPECIKRIATFLKRKASVKKVNRLANSYRAYNTSYNGHKWSRDEKIRLHNYTMHVPEAQNALHYFGYNLTPEMGTISSCADLDFDKLEVPKC